MLPDINFDNIRPHENSRHAGFEELCCQLASLEARPVGAGFFRKGRGGDAGVECFERYVDGSETGWQAKYISAWSDSLASQLDASIDTALKKHPDLSRYVVCLPFDPPDARKKGQVSALQHWEAWKAKQIKSAKKQKRKLDITLWGKSALSERLARDKPEYAGRLLYWFGQETLTCDWFNHQFAKARVGLGSRYTPETNVELPIRQDFLGFVRDPSLNIEGEKRRRELQEVGFTAIRAVAAAAPGADKEYGTPLEAALNEFAEQLAILPLAPDQDYPLAGWLDAAAKAEELARKTLHWTFSLPNTKGGSMGTSPRDWAYHSISTLSELIYKITDEFQSRRWQLTNVRKLLLHGEAGIGKSHLLADVVEHQVNNGWPALMILGSALVEGDPWRQILTQVDWPPAGQVKHFLGALDAAAQAAGVRALICIDALNERHGTEIWPSRLAAFLEEIKPFPRVVVALSCRSTYLKHIVPDSIKDADLKRVEHVGFSGRSGEAAQVYLDKRGIVRPGAPNLVPEFENPLFLKTCCDYLDKEGKRELPRGLRGVTAIFNFYIAAVADALNTRMHLDAHQRIVPKALHALADKYAVLGTGYIEKSEAISIFESIRPSNARLEDSLLAQLESEGVLAVEPVRLEDDRETELVRFTFERFSDHAIATRLLETHIDKANPRASFAGGTPLNTYVFADDAYGRAGVIEAIAVQLPERVGLELLDVVPAGHVDWTYVDAFLSSLLWRNQKFFTDRTMELIREHCDEDKRKSLLVSIATEPDNKFNAHYLHGQLIASPLPDRDQHWSTFVAVTGNEDGNPIETLITWAFNHGTEAIDEDRAELAAIALTWFLSTSNRGVRDRATKALACLLAKRLPLAGNLLQRFLAVNDPYVLERLLAAIYGAVLQGLAKEGLPELADIVYRSLFADDHPPADILLRDHAYSLLLYVRWRGLLPSSVDLKKAGPPYSSAWPIELVPDELIETYKEKHEKGDFGDDIVHSVINDGDFAIYRMNHLVTEWSTAPIGTMAPPTSKEIALHWLDEFLKGCTEEQGVALNALFQAAEGAAGSGWADTPEKKTLKEAEQAFRKTVAPDVWERFRIEAQSYISHTLYGQHHGIPDDPAGFNAMWARRWVCKRAHDFGWTPERFAQFDRYARGSYDRHEHRVERVGKKYQWLALRELIARMADNLTFLGSSPRQFNKKALPAYESATQIGVRDIDPSLLVTTTNYDGWADWPKTWWVPASPTLRPLPVEERLAWRDTDADLINDSSLINVVRPKDGRRWLALQSFSSWRQSEVVNGKRQSQRETWFRLNCIVVRKRNAGKMLKWLSSKRLTASHDLPELKLYNDNYLGEYPWHPGVVDLPDWSASSKWSGQPVPLRSTVVEYTCERGGYDYSIDKTISVSLPAPWLVAEMGLHLADGRKLDYVDTAGKTIFFDPSVYERGPQAALVDRDAFLAMLKRNQLVAFWVIAGEKSVYGGQKNPDPGFAGRLVHTFVYQLKNDAFVRHKHFDSEKPSAEQLRNYLGYEPPNIAAITRPAPAAPGDTASPTTKRPGVKVKISKKQRAPKSRQSAQVKPSKKTPKTMRKGTTAKRSNVAKRPIKMRNRPT